MKEDHPLEQFARAVEGDRTALSAALQALLPGPELQALRQIFKRGAELAETGRHLEWLMSPISEIPRKGFGWTRKAARATTLAVAAEGGALIVTPDTGASKVSPKAGLEVSVRILPGPGYEFKGTPGFAVGFRAPHPHGQIAVSRQRSVRNRLFMKFSRADDTRVFEVLSADLPVIAGLRDPESLLDCEHFKSLKLATSGKARFGASLKAGRSWMHSFDAAGSAVAIRLKASADYALNWERAGDFRVTMSRASGGQLRVWLTESRKRRTARSLSLGAEIKISGLRQSVAPLMQEVAELPDRLNIIVRKYSRPSRLFRDRLRERLKASDPSLRALADVVAGGGERATRRLVNSLIEAMVKSASARAKNWTDLLAGRIDRVVEEALRAAPVPPERLEPLAAHVQSQVGEALDDLNDSLLKDLKAALREDAKPITETLARFAEGPAAVAGRLDASSESLLAPLKRILDRYRTLEERIAKAVETAERERLTIRYGRAVSRSKAASTLLRLRFDPRSERGKSVYRQMLGGDFADAMAAGMDDDNDAITLEKCVFKRAFERKVTSGLRFNLFGREMASRRALVTGIKAENGVGGQINLFEAEGEVTEEHVAFGEGQSMRVSNLIHFLTSPEAPDAFTVHLDYTDRNMKPGELREYLTSLEDAALIAEGAAERITLIDGVAERIADTEDAADTIDTGIGSITIDTVLELSRKDLLKITGNDEETIIRAAIEEQLKSWRRIPWADNALARLADATNHDIADLIFAWRDDSRRRIKRKLGIAGTRMSKTQRHILYLVRGIGERADDLASFVAHWRQLDHMGESVNHDAEQLDGALLGEIRDLHQDMIGDLSAWVDARNWIVGLAREDVSPVAAAFLATLRKLSRGAEEPLIPVITWTEDGDTRRIAVV